MATLLDRLPPFLEFLRESERWPRETLNAYGEALLAKLVDHAHEHSPFYRERLAPLYRRGRGPRLHRWREVPILTRAELAGAGNIDCEWVPPDHGDQTQVHSSGSTGTPVYVQKTQIANTASLACTCRDHEWHQRDRNLALASIRPFQQRGPDGQSFPHWGNIGRFLGFTGPSHILDATATVEEMVAWIHRVNPAYLNVNPSNLRAIVDYLDEHGQAHFDLKGILAMAEAVEDELRARCRARWGVEIGERYSTREAGALAAQCPSARHLHVHAEIVLVEIVDDEGAQVRPGETGRVLVTPYYNYATPLIRYDLGDYARAGEPCECGRSLPVIASVLGRARNMFRRADGSKYWPAIGSGPMHAIYAFRQHRVVQTALDTVELHVVADADPTPEQLDRLALLLRERLHEPLNVAVRRVPMMERADNGKFEEYVCACEEGMSLGKIA